MGRNCSAPILSRPCPSVVADASTSSSGTIEGDIEGRGIHLGLFDTFRRRGSKGASGGRERADPATDLKYLQQWVAEHQGVEAFVEPKTTVTEVTVVLVAADGEWTRRRAGGDKGARRLSDKLNIPVYDVQKIGYPQRMRDFDARRRIERNRELRRELEEG
jgi:hypothetical protein